MNKEIPDNFDHHILLYAKNWYMKSGNIIEDLKILLANYSGTHVRDISEGDIKECLADCFAKYCPECERGKAIQEMLGWGWYLISNRTPQEVIIGKLGITEGKYVDPTQLLPVLVKNIEENHE
jgi:hypothetical protein